MSNQWVITEYLFDSLYNTTYEGLFTLGSGYMHIRGSLEEHLSDAEQNYSFEAKPTWNLASDKKNNRKAQWGTYVPGIYGKHPSLGRQIINLPFFLGFIIKVDDEELDMELCSISNYKRELSLNEAILMRSFIWHTHGGAKISISFERFVSSSETHLSLQKITFMSDKYTNIQITSLIDADIRTNGYDHFRDVKFSKITNNKILCKVLTDCDDEVEIISQLVNPQSHCHTTCGERIANSSFNYELHSGQELIIEKRTAVATTNDLNYKQALNYLTKIDGVSYEQLKREHIKIWQERWRQSDIEIEGDDYSQLAIRLNIYHL